MRRDSGNDPRAHSSESPGGGEPFVDQFTDVDEQLARTNELLEQLNTALSQEPPLGSVDTSPGGGGAGGGFPDHDDPPVYPFDYSRVVDAETFQADPARETFVAPHTGTIRRVVLGWPAGTQQAVGIGVDGPNEEAVIPRGPRDAQYLAYDDQVLAFDVNVSVQKDDELDIRYINNDATAHFVNVEIFHQEREDNAS